MTASTSMQSSAHTKPRTLGELKRIPDFDASGASRSVKNELRRNLLRAIEKGETLFPACTATKTRLSRKSSMPCSRATIYSSRFAWAGQEPQFFADSSIFSIPRCLLFQAAKSTTIR